MIMASMRNWLHGGELHDEKANDPARRPSTSGGRRKSIQEIKEKRVVVVHCKAGKGRSGTMSCAYLISEEGWTAEDALARFTERRMRPQFGAGVSIPSQLRWVSYVDRWTRGGKKYIDRPIEIMEIHVWGLRNGVKVDVEGFEDEGKRIHTFHTFTRDERLVVEGDAPETGGLSDLVWDLAGYSANAAAEKAPDAAPLSESANNEETKSNKSSDDTKSGHHLRKRPTELIKMASAESAKKVGGKVGQLKTMSFNDSSETSLDAADTEEAEPGGMAVILKPKEPIRLPTSDANVSVELRRRTHKSMGLTMVSAVGHVWFNAYFEGKGPEQEGRPNLNGVFCIEWNALDGIKGTHRKGSRAFDRMSVVWRVAEDQDATIVVDEPDEGAPVPQTKAADWKGSTVDGDKLYEKHLGLRKKSPASANVSLGSSVHSDMKDKAGGDDEAAENETDDENSSLAGVRSSGPLGEDLNDGNKSGANDNSTSSNKPLGPGSEVYLDSPDRADGTVKLDSTKIVSAEKDKK